MYNVWSSRLIAKILRCVCANSNWPLSSVTFRTMAVCSNGLRISQKSVDCVLKFGTSASFFGRIPNSFIGCVRAFSVTVHSYKHVPHIRTFVLCQHFVQVQKLRCVCHDTNLKALQEAEIEELGKKLDGVFSKIMFNSVIEFANFKGSWKKRRVVEARQKKLRVSKINEKNPLANIPLSLKYLRDTPEIHKTKENPVESQAEGEFVCLPYSIKTELDTVISSEDQHHENKKDTGLPDQYSELSRSSWNQLPVTVMSNASVSNWMSDYECYDESEDGVENPRPWELNYGTPDTSVPISDVPCGGCGAVLHCQDPAVPGYLPSELFQQQDEVSLRAIVCQRCHFLRFYDTALNVIVSPDDYPKLMAHLKEKIALIVLMIDLLDFPCSIWPGIMNIIGHRQPVVVVGNKVDLLPPDSRGYLQHIQKCLAESLTHSGIPSSNIKHVALLSAKTGYGVEELITRLHNLWAYRGDVYLVGCTNVGKSTLFNALLQSDYCKVKAVDLIQRATTSPWPGTTLNLLKFPILRPSGWRLAERTKRLISQRQQVEAERRLHYIQCKEDTSRNTPALIGHVGMTFQNKKPVPGTDIFSMQHFPEGPRPLSGLDPMDEEYARSKWCYDTPGVVHPDQVIHLLTTEELMMTLPKKLILPRTFCMQPNMSLFIAGLGRLDYVEGVGHIRVTVFSSGRLPITICKMDDADSLYKTLLGTRLLGVPCGGPTRLAQWPMLKAHSEIFELHGSGWKKSCGDIVLSSSGWTAVTFGEGKMCRFQAWTPGGRGVYLRCPALLPFAVTMCGQKIRRSLAHRKGKGMFWKDV